MWRLILNSLDTHGTKDPCPSLLKIDEAPDYQRSNPYIHTGYRGPQSWGQCLASVLQFHNETMNIWTHLLGAFIFLAFLCWDWEHASGWASFWDLSVIIICVILYQACMVLSALYHTFNAHSQEAAEFCLMLDLGGICASITASYISGIYYAFWCHPFLQNFYMITVACFITTGLVFRNTFNKEDYLLYRLVFFIGFVVYGCVPTLHWVILNGGFDSDEVRLFLPRIVIMYLLCGLAFLFYVAKFPEVVLPGRFDILGSSHQWWHLFIFICLAYWYATGMSFAEYRSLGGCEKGKKFDTELKQHMEDHFWLTF